MALEVPHLSCPPTAFPVVLAVYLEVVDTLEELVEAGRAEHWVHDTLGTPSCHQRGVECNMPTNMMATVIQEWIGQ